MSDPSHPAAVLRTLEQRARKRFGQHFLARRDVVDRMVRGAGVGEGSRVVEIGPGLGILTQGLLEAGAELTAVELDRDLAAYVAERFPAASVVEADAAGVDWPALCTGTGWKVVANLPYNVGTTVLMRLLQHPGTFTSVTVMLQKEVVQRLLAEPGNRTYGALTVQVRARGEPLLLFGVPPGAFHPPPKVDSAVVRVDLHPAPRVGPAGARGFDRVVRAAFAQRRKTIANSLASAYGRERSLAALRQAGIDPRARAETLALEPFVALAAALHPPEAEAAR